MLASSMSFRRFYGSIAIVVILASMFATVFVIQPALGVWWDSGWRYRKAITIDHTKVPGDLINFPVLVDITDTDLALKAKTDGSDIAFVGGCCGLQIKHEIEHYNSATGHLVAWVKMPGISSTADSFFYMYYGNPAASGQQSPGDVWDSNFTMVQHFEETSGTHYDSTTYGRNGTVYGGAVQSTTGKIDGADSFDGSDDYIQITGQDLVAGSSNTVSFWEKNMAIGTGYGTIFDDWSGSSGFLWQFGDLSSTFQIGNVGDWNNRLIYTHGGLTDNNWHYFTATLVGGVITLYMDGASVATQSSSTVVGSDGDSVLLMRRSDGHYTTGLMDELEVSNTTRSLEWIRTCYNSQFSPGTFYTVGMEEGMGPVVSGPSPADGATDVPVSLSGLSFNLTSEHLMDYYVSTYPNIGIGSGTGVGNGTYTVSVSGLVHFTTYTWHVNVTDGTNWTNKTYTFSTSGLITFNPAIEGWLYRRKITIDHSSVATGLTDFPVLIEVTDSSLAYHACTCGRDILFMDGSGTANKLSHEIEQYSGGHLIAWVRVPSLSSAVDTVIYMYYGKPTASPQENAAGVWDSSFKMVQHFKEASGMLLDSTSNGVNGTPLGGLAQNVSGRMNGACYFDGVNDYVGFGDSLDITTGGATWSAWVRFDETRVHRLLGKGSNGILLQWYYGGEPIAGTLEIGNIADWPNRALYTPASQDTSWHYLVGVYDDIASKYKMYLDGLVVAEGLSASSLPADNGESFVVGTGYIHDFFSKGAVDEVEVSDTARSAAWIKTCFNNQYSPSSFAIVGDEESAGAPAVSGPSPADGAANLPVSLSQLSFTLTDYQSDLMNYTVTTYPNIGSGSSTGVGNGVYTVSVSGLSYSTVYTWQVKATDGIGWANVSYSFSTQTPSMFDPSTQGWQYRRRITIDHTKVTSNLTDFPLLVDVTDSSLGSHALADGHDILFMDGSGTANKLSHEIERYSSGHLTAWVCVATLSSTTDTVIYMYYGKATASPQENAAGVWDSNFKMMQHLEETSGTVYDSTSNGINGTTVGTVNQNVNGNIDGAAWFNGVNGYVNFGDVLDFTTGGATWSAWLKFDETKVHRFISKGNNGLLVQWFWSSGDGTCELQAGNIADWDNRAVYMHAEDTDWHHVVAVFDDSTSQYKLYLDGELVAVGVTSSLPADNSESFVVGSGYMIEAIGYTKGTIDEVEVSNMARSSAWIKSSYNNQHSPNIFYAIGPEEEAGAPVVSDPSPVDGAVGVSVSLSQLRFSLQDFQSDKMNYTVTTFPNIGSGGATNVGAGIYTISVSGLLHATEYTWHVDVTDGAHWANMTYTFTTRPVIMLSNPSPPEGETRVSYNPRLSISANHELGYLMNIVFSTNATGTWKEIDTYSNVGNGVYTIIPVNITKRDMTYHWSVLANDTYGHSTLQNYTFTIVDFIDQGATPIGNSFCCRFGYIRPARETGQYIATWQHAEHPGPWATSADTPEFGLYDIELGWVKTYTPVFNPVNNLSAVFHDSWGYWDDEYHYMDGVGGTTFELADSSTWEGFQSMDFWPNAYSVGPRTWTNPTPSLYSFNNTNAWIIASDYYSGGMVMKYWPWSKGSGWSAPVPILVTLTANTLDAGQLLQINKTTWRLYYADCSTSQVKYAETNDAGQTWTGPYTCAELTTTSSQCNRVSFARYGDNFYIFLTDSNGDATIYNSTDGAHWANKQVIMHVSGLVHHGTLLHQGALISTIGDLASGDPGIHYGIVTVIPEMLSNPATPSDPYPANWASLPKGTTATTLEVTVHGSQTYNVAFYWANGTFIGEDRLLKEGDRARIQVSITEGTEFRWYAVARGATFDYCGNEPLATSDEARTDTYNFEITEMPELNFNPANVICRKYSENFNLQIDVAHAKNVEDLEFEIHYNTTLLNYTSVSWNAWGTGTIATNDVTGIINGSTVGSAFNGTRTLMTITFHTSYYHIWKDNTSWENILTGSIYIQWANLSISEKPDSEYVRGGSNNQVIAGPDFIYKFSPIQGDINNDGTVDITDLRTVAAYYNVKEGSPMWTDAAPYDLNIDKIIDIFDIVMVAVKYGYTYP